MMIETKPRDMSVLLLELGESFKFDDFRLKLNEADFPEISEEQIELILVALYKNYFNYFEKCKNEVQRDILFTKISALISHLETTYSPHFVHNVTVKGTCQDPFNTIRLTLASKLQYKLEDFFQKVDKQVTVNNELKQRQKLIKPKVNQKSTVLLYKLLKARGFFHGQISNREIAQSNLILTGYSLRNFENVYSKFENGDIDIEEVYLSNLANSLKSMALEIDSLRKEIYNN